MRRENRADPHCYCVAWDIFFSEKVTCGVAAGQAVERDEASQGFRCRAWLVESYVAGAADTKYLDINSAGCCDGFFVRFARLEYSLAFNETIGTCVFSGLRST